MNSKQRVLTALANEVPDRVPMNYAANAAIDRRLKEHYGLSADDHEGLKQALGIDFRRVFPEYNGPRLHEDIPERGVKIDEWGIHRQWAEHETGGYWDYCDFPLRDADEQTVADWPMPSPDDFDYAAIDDELRQYDDYCVTTGGGGIPDVINSTGMIRSMEQVLVDLAVDEPAGLLYVKRRNDIMYEVVARTLEIGKGRIDVLWLGDDLGTQIGPMISLELYRKHLRPYHQRFVDLAKSFDIPVIMHSCGSSSWAYPDFIEIGITAVDTLQPEAKDMAPEYLKKTFGGKLAFHGCISTAGPVAMGTVDDTIAYCRRTLDIMMTGGGYCFAPTHQLQDNSPTQNVVAMYATAREYGVY